MDETERNRAREQVDAIGAAMGLTAAVSELSTELKEVKSSEKRIRFLVRMLIVSLVFDLILTVGIGLVGYSNHYLTNQLQQSNINSCQYSNVVRVDDIKLWTTAINDIDPASKITTPAEAQSKANFIKFIDQTFKSVNCSALVNGSPVK